MYGVSVENHTPRKILEKLRKKGKQNKKKQRSFVTNIKAQIILKQTFVKIFISRFSLSM